MTMLDSGYVGIGTTNPQSLLNIKLPVDNTFNGLRIDNSSGDYRIVAYTDNSDNGYLQLRDSNNDTKLLFGTNGD